MVFVHEMINNKHRETLRTVTSRWVAVPEAWWQLRGGPGQAVTADMLQYFSLFGVF